MEAHRRDVPEADWASSIVAALISIAILILAVVFDWTTRTQPSMPAVAIVFVGVILMGIAIWEPTLGILIRKWRFTKQMRSAYKQHFGSKEQQFAFDGEKWSDQVNAGPWELWSAVRFAAEYKNVIMLQSEKAFALVPKRVLVPSDLAKLRSLAFGEFSVPLKLRVGLREYFLTEIPSLWRRHKSMMVMAHIGGLLVSTSLARTLWTNHDPKDVLRIGVLAGSLLFITVTTQFWYVFVRYVLYWYRVHVSWEIEFSDRGAHVKTATTEHFSSWSAFTNFRETSPAFLLYFELDRYYILPKTFLSAEQRNHLRQTLQGKLQAT